MVTVTNTDLGLIEYLAGLGGKVHSKKQSGSLGTKPCWRWVLCATNEVVELLEATLPQLRVKRDKAEAALAVLREKVTS